MVWEEKTVEDLLSKSENRGVQMQYRVPSLKSKFNTLKKSVI